MKPCKYICLKCDYEFEMPKAGPVDCPMCRSHYALWVNFDENSCRQKITS